MELHRELPEHWAGIPSGTYRVEMLGREREVHVNVMTGEVTADLGDPTGLTQLPDHLIHGALALVRKMAPEPTADRDPEWIAQLRRDNAESNARGDWSCSFTSDEDPHGIPDGGDCGGCYCHLSAPCGHCMDHLPIDDDDLNYKVAMLDASGKATR